MNNSVIIHDDAHALGEWIEPESVHLVVTSPPYWSIKDYGFEGQIGYGQSYGAYVGSLLDIFSQCARTLVPGGRICINIGEQYLSTEDYGRHRIAPGPQTLIEHMHSEYRRSSENFPSIETLDYMGSIIWNKIPTQNASGGGKWMGSTYWPTDIALSFEHEYILIFRKHGNREKPDTATLAASKLTKQQRGEWSRALWRIPPERGGKHPAPFPIAIPDRLIRLFSFYGDTVVDPFLGSGTTMIAAEMAGRRCIGMELSEEFATQAVERCRSNMFVTSVELQESNDNA